MDYLERLRQQELEDREFVRAHKASELRRRLSNALIAMRKRAGLTQQGLADEARWKQPFVARLEGLATLALPSADRIKRYAEACGRHAVILFVNPKTMTVEDVVSLFPDKAFDARTVGFSGTTLPGPKNAPREAEELVVRGEIDGNVKGKAVHVMEDGRVEGQIMADRVRVSGVVVGDIYAHKVEVAQSAHITGDIYREAMTIEKGATIDGNVRRLATDDEDLQQPISLAGDFDEDAGEEDAGEVEVSEAS